MSLNNPKGGIGYAAEFQSSALPYVTSSTAPQSTTGCLRIDFPKITRFITVANHDAAGKELRIGFTRNGVLGGNYYLLDGGQTLTTELRVSQIFFAGDSSNCPFALLAGLTNISSVEMPPLTGTLGDGSPGWIGVG